MPVKYIFITGGVVSGLGKGITAASLGRLLKERGYKVRNQKFDPYINVDPATMSPYQHGEVFVTEDGAEGDLDIGHYERFIDENLDADSDVTTGQVYWSVITKERRGEYDGGTVQVIPHITNEIKNCVHRVAHTNDTDIVITEIGGTVGDIEGLPFLEAIRQISIDVGKQNCMFIHVTLIPYISGSNELKTKPSQHSAKQLLALGIQPDVMVCRCESEIPNDVRQKLALFCNIEPASVILNTTAPTIYEVPLLLEKEGLANVVVKRLGLTPSEPDLKEWTDMVNRIKYATKKVKIGIVGKYIQLHDACLSVVEALTHGGVENDVGVQIEWIDSEVLTSENVGSYIDVCDGIVVPGAIDDGGEDGKLLAIEYARVQRVPMFAICQGVQLCAIEYARNVAGLTDAHSIEFDEHTKNPIFVLKKECVSRTGVSDKISLGAAHTEIKEGTLCASIYQTDVISERHRHRYEFNLEYQALLEKNGLIFSGYSPDKRFVDVIELADHPWYLGVHFHPEFKSRPNKAHPLFKSFIKKCAE